MPFCACPAGSFRMLDHKVTITRPFLIGNCHAEARGIVPRDHDLMRFVAEHTACFMVVIGPDLEVKKKAAKK